MSLCACTSTTSGSGDRRTLPGGNGVEVGGGESPAVLRTTRPTCCLRLINAPLQCETSSKNRPIWPRPSCVIPDNTKVVAANMVPMRHVAFYMVVAVHES